MYHHVEKICTKTKVVDDVLIEEDIVIPNPPVIIKDKECKTTKKVYI